MEEIRFGARVPAHINERFTALAQKLKINKTRLFIDAFEAYEKKLESDQQAIILEHIKKLEAKLDVITALIAKDKLNE